MGFSFNEPTTTHPDTAEVVEQTEVETDVNATDTPDVDAGTRGPTGEESKSDEDAGGEADGGDVPEGTEQDSEVDPKVEQGEVSYFYGDEAVSIEVDASHREAFAEKGLDIDALAAELYKEGGNFTLSEESLNKCYEAFGKFSIDAFLSGLKAQNEAAVQGWKTEAEARIKADEDRFNSLAADVGGVEGWGRLETFALETLSDEELKGFNEVMQSGNQYLQQYALRDLETKRKAAQGDDEVKLIEGRPSASGDGESGPLNARDYIKATAELGGKFPHDKAGYAKAQAQLDARRRAGHAAGL